MYRGFVAFQNNKSWIQCSVPFHVELNRSKVTDPTNSHCQIVHPCALHLPCAFRTRSRTPSRTHTLSFHSTPSFQLLIQAEAQRLAAFTDCCGPAQHLANSCPRGGSDTPSSLFSMRDTREMICLLYCALRFLSSSQSWHWYSVLTQQDAVFLLKFVLFLASYWKFLWSSEFPVV